MANNLMINMDSYQVKHLMDADERLETLITYIGNLKIPLQDNLFASLVRAINGQLLSAKVADIIHARLVQLLDQQITPESISKVSDDDLRGVGISIRKISYIRDLANRVLDGELVLDELYNQEDDDIIETLTSIKGIGQWTVQVFLIFSFGREDVLAIKDVGLHRGVKWLYQLENNQEGLEILKDKSELWKPYRTIASHYLWEIVNRDYIQNYKDIFELTK